MATRSTLAPAKAARSTSSTRGDPSLGARGDPSRRGATRPGLASLGRRATRPDGRPVPGWRVSRVATRPAGGHPSWRGWRPVPRVATRPGWRPVPGWRASRYARRFAAPRPAGGDPSRVGVLHAMLADSPLRVLQAREITAPRLRSAPCHHKWHDSAPMHSARYDRHGHATHSATHLSLSTR